MIDQRSLFMHREVAQMIRRNPELYNRVKNPSTVDHQPKAGRAYGSQGMANHPRHQNR